jgi:hypothetical protein
MSSKDKIQYIKPQVQDLGAVAPVYGGLCETGSLNESGTCDTGGIANQQDFCTTGEGAINCNTGFSANNTR